MSTKRNYALAKQHDRQRAAKTDRRTTLRGRAPDPGRVYLERQQRAADKIAARNFVAAYPSATPFVARCARSLDTDPGWLPSESQAELLCSIALRFEEGTVT